MAGLALSGLSTALGRGIKPQRSGEAVISSSAPRAAGRGVPMPGASASGPVRYTPGVVSPFLMRVPNARELAEQAERDRGELEMTGGRQSLELERKRYDDERADAAYSRTRQERLDAQEAERYTESRNALTGLGSALPGPGGGAAIPPRISGPGGADGTGTIVPPPAAGGGAPVGAGGGAALAPPGDFEGPLPGVRPDPTNPDGELARANAYGRAKDDIGLSMQSALRGLQGALVDTGRAGGGFEAGAVGDLFESGLGELGDVSRDMAADDVDRGYEVEDRDYAGNLHREDRDVRTALDREGMYYSGGIQQRGQDMGFQQSAADRLASLMARFARSGSLY